MSEKTEEPTPKRLRQAREKGDTGFGHELPRAIGLAVGFALLVPAGTTLAAIATRLVRAGFAAAREKDPSVALDTSSFASDVLSAALPLSIAVLVATVAVTLVASGGFVFAPARLAPKLTNLDPIAGLARLVSREKLATLLRAACLGGFVLYATARVLRAHLADVSSAAGRSTVVPALSVSLVKNLATPCLAALVTFAAFEAWLTRRAWQQRLRMSRHEVDRERKDSEGNAEVKHARDRVQQEVLFSASLARVAQASFVVVNPTHLACALEYGEGREGAPELVAKGQGTFAERIVREAEAHGVPVLRDVGLARALVELDVGEEIPEVLYEAVAVILHEIGKGA